MSGRVAGIFSSKVSNVCRISRSSTRKSCEHFVLRELPENVQVQRSLPGRLRAVTMFSLISFPLILNNGSILSYIASKSSIIGD